MSQNNPDGLKMSDFRNLRTRTGLSVTETAERLGYRVRTVYRWERGESEPKKAVIDLLKVMIKEPEPKYGANGPAFKFIDLFAGIGGMRLGFEASGGECVFTSEWNKYSQATYLANFPSDEKIHGDITAITDPRKQIPEHDVLVAGFPCQPFSIAGVSKKNALGRPHGFRCEAQGTLFFDVARIIEAHRPKAFLLENVKNLRSHDGGRTFDVIYRTLAQELGYNVSVRVINGEPFVPQHRERVFIAGFRDHSGFDLDELILPETAPQLRSILHPEDGTEQAEAPYTEGPQAKVARKYTLTAHLWEYLQNYAKKHQEKGNGFGFGLVGPDDIARTLSARYYKDGSEVLIRNRPRPRRLTPRECARLMGFDRPGKALFKIPVSDTQSYKQFGNAVIVPVVEAVAKHMLPWITGEGVVQKDLFAQNRSLRKVA
jgi:DNA (cytosine-5)-methyltransferase 1